MFILLKILLMKNHFLFIAGIDQVVAVHAIDITVQVVSGVIGFTTHNVVSLIRRAEARALRGCPAIQFHSRDNALRVTQQRGTEVWHDGRVDRGHRTSPGDRCRYRSNQLAMT